MSGVLSTLAPVLRGDAEDFIRWLNSQGVRVGVTSARRSRAQQVKLYNRYIHGLSKYPAALPGTSTHELGLAFDLALDPPVYAEAGAAWEKATGGRWGGRFSDPVHFEAARRFVNIAQEEGQTAEQTSSPLEMAIGKWWTGFVPGVGSVIDWLSRQ